MRCQLLRIFKRFWFYDRIQRIIDEPEFHSYGIHNRKNDRVKYLEGKLEELKTLVRQKNASIESSAKEIDRLKSQLRQANAIPESAPIDTQSNHTSEELEDHSDLNSMLNKAEANLAAVNRLSEEVIAQKEELHRKANIELESVKVNLLSAEEEIRSLRAQLADKLTENENLSRQLAQVSKEMAVKNTALEDAKDIRSKMLSDHSAKDEALKRLESEKDAALKKANELSDELEKEVYLPHLMPDTNITNEMKRHTVIVSIEAKHSSLRIARFLKVARSFVCNVRKELLDENNGDELAATRKRKVHYECSAD
ncbi:hypothetical protein ACTXT7_012437 [Hymenolepis weldensis]